MKPTKEIANLAFAYKISIHEAELLLRMHRERKWIFVKNGKPCPDHGVDTLSHLIEVKKNGIVLPALLESKAITIVDGNSLSGYDAYRKTHFAGYVIDYILAGVPVAVGGDGCPIRENAKYVYLFYERNAEKWVLSELKKVRIEQLDGYYSIDEDGRALCNDYIFLSLKSAIKFIAQKMAFFIP